MEKLCVFFLLAIMVNAAVGMSFRSKRQSDDENGENNLEERYGWERPRQNWFPNRPWTNGQNQNQLPTPGQNNPRPTQTPNNGATSQSPSVADCIRTCPATPEYNPVCGTDNITYNNPGRLGCAQSCGVGVSLLRAAPCPSTTAAPGS